MLTIEGFASIDTLLDKRTIYTQKLPMQANKKEREKFETNPCSSLRRDKGQKRYDRFDRKNS